MSGLVAIVGRPNVGKSTLFNRLIGERKAIVDDASGVTRDRHYGKAEWLNTEFMLVDTGGYVAQSDDMFEKNIRSQVKIAMDEADLLLFMVDVTTDVTDLDQSFSAVLRKSNKPVLVVVNKTDNFDRIHDAAVFYSLGFKEIFPVSSLSGQGTGELLDRVLELIPDKNELTDITLPKIALVGRPNVGKSSICNALLGEERNIVTNIPGTTRDTIHSHYNGFGMEFILLDTAGIRKKEKVHEDIEFYSVMRSVRAIEECDVTVLVIDAKEGLESQDVNLFRLADKNGKGIVILVNKWDLVEKDHKTSKEYEELIRLKIAPFIDVPILFVSALTKQRIFKAAEIAMDVYKNMSKHIPTSKINEVMLPIIQDTPPPSKKGKYIRIKYVTQLKSKKVAFAFFCNLPQYVSESYKRFLENRLRENFNFNGVPILVLFKKK
jgi:GTP-binding protein